MREARRREGQMLKRVTVTAAILVIALFGAVIAGSVERTDETSAAPEAPILINPDICTALLAGTAADDSTVQHYFFSCNNPLLFGGSPVAASGNVFHGGVLVANILMIAAGSQRNGDDDNFVEPGFPECQTSTEEDDINELLCALDNRNGAIDGVFTIESTDFAGIDLDGNQMSEVDGQLLMVVFVDDDAPVLLETTAGQFFGAGDNEFLCDTEAEDEDCDNDGVAGDGIVAYRIDALDMANRGTNSAQATQNSITFPTDFLVTGESDSAEFFTLESSIQASGLTEDDCPLIANVPDAVEALGRADKTVILGRTLDDEGTQLTGAFMGWDVDDADKAIWAAPGTPTLDLGSFGFGAPNVLCGVDVAGTVELELELLNGAGEADLFGVGFNTAGDNETIHLDFTVVGAPANMTLSAAPAELACDGIATSTVSATVTDVDGNPVVNGNEVTFSVQVLGTANPIVATTGEGGIATSVITPLATGAPAGVPVVVTVDDLESSILVNCTGAVGPGTAPPPPPPGGGTPGTGISGPDTGSGPGEVDGAGALSWWPVLALVAGAAALATLRFAVRRI
jgi:hypothetical protein